MGAGAPVKAGAVPARAGIPRPKAADPQYGAERGGVRVGSV